MKTPRIIDVALVVLIAVLGCTRGKREHALADSDTPAQVASVAHPAEAVAAASPPPTRAAEVPTQMIIRNGELAITVDDADQSLTTIRSIAKRHDAFIADSRVWRVEERHRASIVLRVPASKIDALIGELKQIAIRVETETLTGQDVTAEYVDLGARLRNLEAAEAELRELMRTVRQQAKKAADILEVYRELTTIRGEIEQVKGRMKYLAEQSALASLRVELIPDIFSKPLAKTGWRPVATIKEASRALVLSAQKLADGAIWLVLYIVPILVILALPFVVILRWRRPATS